MNKNLKSIKKQMKSQGIDALIIPSTDPHQSEYVADYWKLRSYFSGFTGSAGTLVITKDTIALWTDSRYFLQVEMECKNTGVSLYKQTIPHAPEHISWLCDLLDKGTVIALDFRQFSKSQIDYLLGFANPKNIRLQDERNFADDILVG